MVTERHPGVQGWTKMEEKKLKTMNEISAYDAWMLFEGYLDTNGMEYGVAFGGWVSGTPEDAERDRESREHAEKYEQMLHEIPARDFLECLKMYTDALNVPAVDAILSQEQRRELADTIQDTPEADLEKIVAKMPRALKDVFLAFKANPSHSDKELGTALNRSESTIGNHMGRLFKLFKVRDRIALAQLIHSMKH
jgi:hypothetical protein